jgi:hypothetical protein
MVRTKEKSLGSLAGEAIKTSFFSAKERWLSVGQRLNGCKKKFGLKV